MVFIHILGGLAAITAGFVALLATKGSPLHRRAGLAFVASMLVMAGSAAWLAVFSMPNRAHVVAALMAIYLVCTGYLTVWRKVEESRGLLAGLMLLGLAVGTYALMLGASASAAGLAFVDDEPIQIMFVFGTIALVGGLFDGRLLITGGIRGRSRLARHLWRMGFGMFIATGSLFFGQPDLFPPALEPIGLRAIPVLIVIAVPAYWLIRLSLARLREGFMLWSRHALTATHESTRPGRTASGIRNRQPQ